ncbi:MAG TPA: gamma carbonic anhydrase family protein [Bacilli bacterium]
MIHAFSGKAPRIDKTAYIAAGAQIIGDVSIGEQASVWFNAVLRGDLAPIIIGNKTNIQDGGIGHVNAGQPLVVAEEVTVGHGAVIHACQIGKGTLIGMGAIVLSGAIIGEYALIGAGSLVTEHTKIPPYTLALGSPAKVVRELTENDLRYMRQAAENYVRKAREFCSGINADQKM